MFSVGLAERITPYADGEPIGKFCCKDAAVDAMSQAFDKATLQDGDPLAVQQDRFLFGDPSRYMNDDEFATKLVEATRLLSAATLEGHRCKH